MSRQHSTHFRTHGGVLLAFCLAVFFGAWPDAPARAASHDTGPISSASLAPAPAAAQHHFLIAGWTDSVGGFFDSMTGNKTRVIQFTMVAMILALWVIWWRK